MNKTACSEHSTLRFAMWSLVCMALMADVGAQQSGPQPGAGQMAQTQSPPPLQAQLAPTPKPPTPPLTAAPARIAPAMQLIVGKSTLLRLPDVVERISVGNPQVADVVPVSERELYLLGRTLGATNVIIWSKGGPTTVIDVTVTPGPFLLDSLKADLAAVLPDEKNIQVRFATDSIVLQGIVSDAVKASQAVQVAEAWVRQLTRALIAPVGGAAAGGTNVQVGLGGGAQQTAQVAGPRVINMLSVRAPMQVMLEVKVAEVSKNLLSKLGISTRFRREPGNLTFDVLGQSDFFNQLLGAAVIARGAHTALQIDAQRDDALVRLLAEPNIMAISGQQASFRAGGKIFIPVQRTDAGGRAVVTLEEKEYGVGLRFKPTVLEGGRINLHVEPEVSELQAAGNPFTSANGVTSVLPSFTLRRAETTVQLHDGQSFMIAGLIQSNLAQTIRRFPGLGDIPILGALFRSTEFQNEQTELMFIITPRLVKPLPAQYAMPGDSFVPPSPTELFLEGKLEGAVAPPAPKPGIPGGGFEMK